MAPPFVIFKGREGERIICEYTLENIPQDSGWALQDEGWADKRIFLNGLKRFENLIAQKSPPLTF